MDPELDALIGQDAEDPFDAWDMVFGDWNVEESHYIGDPTWLESDIEYNYYDTDIDWGDESDWGDVSDWGYDGGNYGDFGGWDYAFDW